MFFSGATWVSLYPGHVSGWASWETEGRFIFFRSPRFVSQTGHNFFGSGQNPLLIPKACFPPSKQCRFFVRLVQGKTRTIQQPRVGRIRKGWACWFWRREADFLGPLVATCCVLCFAPSKKKVLTHRGTQEQVAHSNPQFNQSTKNPGSPERQGKGTDKRV